MSLISFDEKKNGEKSFCKWMAKAEGQPSKRRGRGNNTQFTLNRNKPSHHSTLCPFQ